MNKQEILRQLTKSAIIQIAIYKYVNIKKRNIGAILNEVKINIFTSNDKPPYFFDDKFDNVCVGANWMPNFKDFDYIAFTEEEINTIINNYKYVIQDLFLFSSINTETNCKQCGKKVFIDDNECWFCQTKKPGK